MANFGYYWLITKEKNFQESQWREPVLVRKWFLTRTASPGRKYMSTLGWELPPPAPLSPQPAQLPAGGQQDVSHSEPPPGHPTAPSELPAPIVPWRSLRSLDVSWYHPQQTEPLSRQMQNDAGIPASRLQNTNLICISHFHYSLGTAEPFHHSLYVL